MAHVLSITDGTTTKTLADGTSCLLRSYTPKSSREGEDVTENVDITIQADSLALARTYMNEIGALFSQAAFNERFRQNYIKDNGSPVYINFDPNTSGTTLRSRCKGGRIVANAETLESDISSGAVQLDVTIEWTRQGFFEGPETEIALASTYNGAGATGGYVVKNRDDSGGQNRAYIPAGQIVGDMPAPLKLMIANNVAGNFIDEIIIGHGLNAKNTGKMKIEAENNFTAGFGTTATTIADANCSNGNYKAVSWTSLSGSEQLLGYWQPNLTDVLQTYTRGNRYMVVMRLRDTVAYTDLWAKLYWGFVVGLGVTSSLVSGNLILIPPGRQLVMLDTFRYPSVGTYNVVWDYLLFNLKCVRSTNGATAINLDYLYFIPISGDNGWMRIKNSISTGGLSYAGGSYYWLTLDPYNSSDFQTYDNQSASFAVDGGPIMLFPGVWQYLALLASYSDGTSPISLQTRIKAYYRPRYNLF